MTVLIKRLSIIFVIYLVYGVRECGKDFRNF